jgi:XTP/dITP diphosphohydrolase
MQPIRKLVIATHNRKKAGEMIQILSARFPDIELLTLADFPSAPEPEETGTTYAENATIKALSAARFTGEWSVADDAGLEIDALDGAPGLYSKRFGGEDLPFPEKMSLILGQMNDVTDENRTARFRCCIALAPPQPSFADSDPDGHSPYSQGRNPHSAKRLEGIEAENIKVQIFEATCEGRIAKAPSGIGGFGYDPIFLPNDAPGRSMADLTSTEKHAISHRGKVLGQFAEYLAKEG